jgi:hypothetical protein
MPLDDQCSDGDEDRDRDGVPNEEASSSMPDVDGHSSQQKLNEKLENVYIDPMEHAQDDIHQQKMNEKLMRKAHAASATPCGQYGYKSQDALSDSKTVTTISSTTTKVTGRRCVDLDPVDRPEVPKASLSSGHSGNLKDRAATVIVEASRSTKPLRELSHTVVVDDGDPCRIGSRPPGALTADVALSGGTMPDVEQGGLLEAQPIDEEIYRQRIENEYRDRLLRQAVVDASPGFVRAEDDKDSLPAGEGRFCSMSRRTTLIATILVILIVIALTAGVTVAVTRPSPTIPSTTVVPNATIAPTPFLSCEERCNMSSSRPKVDADGLVLKRAILLYLEGKDTLILKVAVIPF